MSGFGRIGSAGNGNPWGYGSTSNQPSEYPTQAPAGSYGAQQAGFGGQPQSLHRQYPTQAPAGSYGAQQAGFGGQPQSLHRQYPTQAPAGDPNEKNLAGFFIRDEHGEVDAPHERDNTYQPQQHVMSPQYLTQTPAGGYGVQQASQGRKTPPPKLDSLEGVIDPAERKKIQNRNGQRMHRYNHKYK